MSIISDNIPASAYNIWFANIRPQEFTDQVLWLAVPSQFVCEYIEAHYEDLLNKTIDRVFGKEIGLMYRFQIDKTNEEYQKMFTEGTHFNPVDLVCAVKDYKGRRFNLPDYVDKSTGFISSKSKNGKELKALELPGLWNGAMSDWSTIFVEVPLSTFNPVKTVNDLLREQHQ